MNLVIIGAGPAGEATAKTVRRLASQRKESVRIIVVEKEHAGGLCLNKGCIPSKTLLEQIHKNPSGQALDWKRLQGFKNEVVTGIRSQLESAFKTLKIDLLRGEACFKDASTLEITSAGKTESLPFDKAVIATGTDIFFPPPLDQLRSELLDSDRVLELSATPRSIVVVGGGAVGCEFACLLNAAGSQVTLVELKDQLLPGEDMAVTSALQRSFEERGIVVKTGVKVSAAEKAGNGWKLALSNGESLEAEKVLVCVGRKPVTDKLGLDKASIKLDKGAIVLNDRLQTTNPNVFVAGDAGTTRLAHAAAAQGEAVAENIFGGNKIYDGQLVPRCLYSWPEVASVGAWKYEREAANLPVKATRAFFKGSSKALAAGEADGFVQVVSDPESGKLLGAQIIGAHATEIIHVFSVALKAGMTIHELGEVMFAHPTLSELAKDACRR